MYSYLVTECGIGLLRKKLTDFNTISVSIIFSMKGKFAYKRYYNYYFSSSNTTHDSV